jgi:hypothetical protein
VEVLLTYRQRSEGELPGTGFLGVAIHDPNAAEFVRDEEL